MTYDEACQIFIPESYSNLYRDGRGRLTVPKPELAAGYGTCEDMAQMLIDQCRAANLQDGVDEGQILMRCHAGLEAAGVFKTEQSEWVIRRAAELLDWQYWLPDFPEAQREA